MRWCAANPRQRREGTKKRGKRGGLKVFNHATSKCCTSMYYAYTIRFRKIDVWGVLRIYRLLMSGLDSFPFFSPSKLLRSPLQKKEKKKRKPEKKRHTAVQSHVGGRERTREDARSAARRGREESWEHAHAPNWGPTHAHGIRIR